MTDHTVFEEQICALLDGELSDGEAAALRAHLDECPDCRAFLEAMKAVYGLSAKDLPNAPSELSKNVMERVRAEAAAGRSRGRVIRFPFRSLAAAAAAALVLWAGARTLPAFRAKSAASSVAAAGVAQESALPPAEESSAESYVELDDDLEPRGYGAVNGSALFDASAEDSAGLFAESLPSAPALAPEAAEEEAAASPSVPTVTVRGSELLWNGEPLTLGELEDRLNGTEDLPDGVELELEVPDPDTESAVRALLEALNIPVREP